MRMVYPEVADIAAITEHYPWPSGAWLRASMVATVDGAGVGPDGRSASISTPADFELFKALRNNSDVIIVGAGTARAEQYNPPSGPARLAVVTRSGNLDSTLPFIANARPESPPLVITTVDARSDALDGLDSSIEVIRCGNSTVDLVEAKEQLAQRGLVRMVTEGGPSLLADLAAAGAVDEYDVQVTPLLAGGSYSSGSPAGRIMAHTALPESPQPLELAHVLTDGATLFLRYLTQAAAQATRA